MFDRRAIQGLIAVATVGGLACAVAPTVQPGPPAPTPPSEGPAPVSSAARGGLAFSVEPGDAEVIVDGRSLGSAAALARGGALALEAGLYQVTLRRAGYATWRAEVAVGATVETIRVALSPRAPTP